MSMQRGCAGRGTARSRSAYGRLFLGPLAFLGLLLLPLNLNWEQQALAAIMSFTIIYWLTEAIPIPVPLAPDGGRPAAGPPDTRVM